MIRAAALAVALLAGLAATAAADTEATPEQKPEQKQEQAKAHFDRGVKHFEARAYKLAIEEYVAAFRLAPFPELVFNIGTAYRLAGKDANALEAYQMYLQQAPQGELADEARAHVLAFRTKGVAASQELASPQSKKDADWRALTESMHEVEASRTAAFEYRRRRVVVGADYGRFGHGTNFAAQGGMYLRLTPYAAFQPRVLLGYMSGDTDRGFDTSGVSLVVQARLLAYPTPWFFAGGGLGLGASGCSERSRDSMGNESCGAGIFGSLFFEVGFLISDRYEVGVRLHTAGILDDADIIDSDAPDLPLIALTVAYHL